MMKASQQLSSALVINKQYASMGLRGRSQVIDTLGASGLFSAKDIHIITGATLAAIGKAYKGEWVNRNNENWSIKTLDALVLIAVAYEDDESVSPVLVRRVMQWGTPLATIARLTQVPLSVLRESVYALES